MALHRLKSLFHIFLNEQGTRNKSTPGVSKVTSRLRHPSFNIQVSIRKAGIHTVSRDTVRTGSGIWGAVQTQEQIQASTLE